MKPFIEITDAGVLRFNFHKDQGRAMTSLKRFIAIIAGAQSGKTCVGPAWLHREIILRGPGDYLVVAPTFKLLDKKALPEFKRLFQDLLVLGNYRSSALGAQNDAYRSYTLHGRERDDRPGGQ